MRLLHTSTLKLHEFIGSEIPQYAILSHTWGKEEILFEDARHGSAQLLASKKKGFHKVLDSATKAREDGWEYIWIDTCCIDKSSSAELSEAINSMFAWYEKSAICYAYLSDVKNWLSWTSSRWFTRGWTLQELIAPEVLVFYDADWNLIGNRSSLAQELSTITKIDELALRRHYWSSCPDNTQIDRCQVCGSSGLRNILDSFSVATRMFWASARVTTRAEDMSYCLLGLFDVNMPLLYGEGAEKAFRRLQEALLNGGGADDSILAWNNPTEEVLGAEEFARTILAPSPAAFQCPINLRSDEEGRAISTLKFDGGMGINLTVLLGRCSVKHVYSGVRPYDVGDFWFSALQCSETRNQLSTPTLLLAKTGDGECSFGKLIHRDWASRCIFITPGATRPVRMVSPHDPNRTYLIDLDLGGAQEVTIFLSPLHPTSRHTDRSFHGSLHEWPFQVLANGELMSLPQDSFQIRGEPFDLFYVPVNERDGNHTRRRFRELDMRIFGLLLLCNNRQRSCIVVLCGEKVPLYSSDIGVDGSDPPTLVMSPWKGFISEKVSAFDKSVEYSQNPPPSESSDPWIKHHADLDAPPFPGISALKDKETFTRVIDSVHRAEKQCHLSACHTVDFGGTPNCLAISIKKETFLGRYCFQCNVDEVPRGFPDAAREIG